VCGYLAGNLCRCGSYVKILDAVLDGAGRLRGSDRAVPAMSHAAGGLVAGTSSSSREQGG